MIITDTSLSVKTFKRFFLVLTYLETMREGSGISLCKNASAQSVREINVTVSLYIYGGDY